MTAEKKGRFMKKLISLLLVFNMLSLAMLSVWAEDGDNSPLIERVDPVLTDKEFAEKVSGHLFMYPRSPRVRVGEEILPIDAENDKATPQLVGGSYMLPAELLAAALGADLEGDTSAVRLDWQGGSVMFEADSTSYSVNGETHTLADAPKVFDNHLYIPLRATYEAAGKKVQWDKCGIIIAGDAADSFSWEDKAGYDLLLRATRDMLYETPSPEEVVSALRANNEGNRHPRLLVTAEKIPTLQERVRNEEPFKTWFASVKRKADTYLTYSEEKLNISYVLEDGIRLLYVSRRAATYIENLAFTYLMTGEEKYADKAIEVTMKVCGKDFPDWHPVHFLDTAEMAAAVALCYDWCYDRLRPSQRWIAKNAMVEKALKPVMEDYNEVPGRQRTWYWSSKSSASYPQNWVSVCFGGTAMAALAIGDEDLGEFTEVGKVITEGMERQKDLYETYMPDGAFIDGTGYWQFAMSYLVLGLDSMKTAIGTDYSMTNNPGIAKTCDWLAQAMGPGGGFNYDSNVPTFTDSPEYFWMANVTGNTGLIDHRLQIQMGKWKMQGGFKDIIWYEPTENDTGFAMEDTFSSRGGVGMSVMRSGFDDMDTYIAMFGSYMDKQEAAHDFDGTFVLDMLGKRWGMDLGAEQGTYGSSGTPKHYYYRCRAEGSNTVIIQPGMEHDQDPGARAKQERLETNDHSSLVIYDLTQQLEYKGATSWRRGMQLDRDTNRVIIQDELTASKNIEYYWFMHTEADIKISDDGRSAVLTLENRKIMANLTSPDESLRLEVMDAVPLPTSPNPSHQEKNTGVTKLTVHATDVKNVEMAVEFIPLYGDETEEETAEFVPLTDWQLSDTPSFDKSLTLTGLSIGGEPVKNFSPDQRYYSTELGLSGFASLPTVEAQAQGCDVTVVLPTEENYVGKIVITDPANRSRTNEYYVDFYLKNFANAIITMETPPIYAIGVRPSNLKEIKVAKVEAEIISQAENPPEAMLDGNLQTRYSVQGLGATVDFDLGSEQTVTHIGTGVYDGDQRGMMYVLASSNDGKNWEEVISVKTSGTTNSMEYYEVPKTTARYFRMYCCGNTVSGSSDNAWYSITEMGFYNKR